jgi:N-acetylglucosaminyldiphosphoundecaprenol N-acetyl-beta-D-mannosaminyltransferase
VTVNPEILLHAHRNPDYHNLLTQADMRVVDGFGAKLFSGVTHRITGVELTNCFLEYAALKNWSVLCLVRPDGLSSPKKIQEAFQEWYENLDITIVTDQVQAEKSITEKKPQLILCSLGFPRQEIILAELQSQLHGTISIGIGGTFDFLTGAQKRAPRIFRQFGLEWLWRLIQQPTRIKRIFDAVIRFPLAIIFNRPKK